MSLKSDTQELQGTPTDQKIRSVNDKHRENFEFLKAHYINQQEVHVHVSSIHIYTILIVLDLGVLYFHAVVYRPTRFCNKSMPLCLSSMNNCILSPKKSLQHSNKREIRRLQSVSTSKLRSGPTALHTQTTLLLQTHKYDHAMWHVT